MPSVALSRLVPATHRRVGRMTRHGADWRAIARRLALENSRLQVQMRAQLDEVRKSQARLVDASDTERRAWSEILTTGPNSGS